MISGLFLPARPPYPFVSAEPTILGLRHEIAPVNFLIDTGAARTCIHPLDANLIMRIPRSRLMDARQWSSSVRGGGVGGAGRYFVEPATLTFTNDDGSPEVVETEIWIAEMTLANQRLPSLLGWDILRHFRLITDGKTVTLDRLPLAP